MVFKFRHLPDAPNILSSDVEVGDITMSVVSSGNITNGAMINEELPTGVKIESVLVEVGDLVDVGDPLAVVSEASVNSQINLITDAIKELDKDINKQKGDTESASVKTNVSGRIKQLFAETGDYVEDVMLANGGLAVLSVDGKMTVTIEYNNLSVGGKLNVLLENASKVTGTVRTIKGNQVTIEIGDNGPGFDELVTVQDMDGKTLGQGRLTISQPVTIVASDGRVKSISVDLNGYVSAGGTIMTLEELPPTAEYLKLLSDRDDLVDTLLSLVALKKNNLLTASVSGTINTLNIEAGEVTSKGVMSSSGADGYSSSIPYDLLGLLSSEPNDATTVTLDAHRDKKSKSKKIYEVVQLGVVEITEITNSMLLQGLYRIIPSTGAFPVATVETDEYFGYISYTPSDLLFMPDVQYIADISLVAKESYIFPAGLIPNFGLDIIVSNISIDGNSPENSMSFRMVFPKTSTLDGILSLIPDNINLFDGLFSLDGLMPDFNLDDLISASIGDGFSMPDYSSLLGGALGNNTSFGSSGSDNENMMTAVVIASNETMTLNVEVDELDILKIQKGQPASVTFDAIPNREFEAIITRISSSAAGSSGVARYSVELTIGKDADMRSGMNATAKIKIDEKNNVFKIPVDAIQEQVGFCFVYLEYTGGILSDEREITTGISDGEYVEVIDGLTENDTVHYEMKSRGFSYFRMLNERG